MKNLKRKIKRLTLGTKWKHLDTLHRDFQLKRREYGHETFWKGQSAGIVRSIKPLEKTVSGVCFIVATGPSLQNIDLRFIKEFDTISLNGAIRKFNEAKFSPTHAVAVDRRIFERCPEFITESIQSGANCFFSPVGISRICEYQLGELDRCYLLESITKKYDRPRIPTHEFYEACAANPKIYIPDNPEERSGGTIGFSNDASAGFFSFKTVAGWAVQLAVWMGYRDIFIIGMDLGGTGMKHFYENEQNKAPDFLKDYDPYIKVSFEQVRRAGNKLGFSVYNLSDKSTLPNDIIPKLTLDNALAIAKRGKK